MASKFTANQARSVTLRHNSSSTESALRAVSGAVWSDDFWAVMEQKVGLSLELFMHTLTNGRAINMMMTTKQCDALLKLQRQAENDNSLTSVFSYLHPQHVSATRINYCQSCGAYHERNPVFVLKSDEQRYEEQGRETMPWDDSDDYGIYCSNCDTPLRVNDSAVYAHQSQRERFDGIAEYVDGTDVEEFFEGWLSWYNKYQYGSSTVHYLEQQLEASDLDFRSYMSKEDYEKLPT